jgi:prophage antirepressor-like protein
LEKPMSELSVFNFDSYAIRTMQDSGQTLFVANDLCAVLDLGNTSQACSRLDDDEKLVSPLMMAGQTRDVTMVTESGMYSLILTSRKKEAKAFKKWVTSVVLPSIRKTGSYVTHQTGLQDQLLEAQRKIIALQEQLLLSMQKRKSYINYDEKDKTNHVQDGEKITKKILNYLAESGETPVWRVIKALKMDKATGTPYIHQLVISKKVTMTTHKPEGGKTRMRVALA